MKWDKTTSIQNDDKLGTIKYWYSCLNNQETDNN